jgi:hypothetical protein
MAVAAELMQDNQPGMNPDGVDADEYELYKEEALKHVPLVNKQLRALAANHVLRSGDLDTVGGYPRLRDALGKESLEAFNKAFIGILPNDEPFTTSEAFRVMVLGIEAMATVGDELYGEAYPSIEPNK